VGVPDTFHKNIPGMKEARPVARRDAADLAESEFFAEFVSQSRPCLIKGAILDWPAGRNWRDPAYLKTLCGHYQVVFFPHENHVTFQRMLAGKEEMRFAEALDRLHARQTEVATLILQQDFPELRRDIRGFAFLTQAEPSFFYPPVRYFIHRNAGSAWHYHPFDETLMCQAIGAKKVGLLNARTPYQKEIQEIFFQEDYYDDPSLFDRLDNAGLEFLVAEVEEGDALYIPPLWWHGVSPLSRDFGMTIAVPWRSPLPIVADSIRKMAAGEVDLMGATSQQQFDSLIAAAGKLGLARELAAAMERAHAMPAAL
jgi:quercetin dioxygenase-like cupin family protein